MAALTAMQRQLLEAHRLQQQRPGGCLRANFFCCVCACQKQEGFCTFFYLKKINFLFYLKKSLKKKHFLGQGWFLIWQKNVTTGMSNAKVWFILRKVRILGHPIRYQPLSLLTFFY